MQLIFFDLIIFNCNTLFCVLLKLFILIQNLISLHKLVIFGWDNIITQFLLYLIQNLRCIRQSERTIFELHEHRVLSKMNLFLLLVSTMLCKQVKILLLILQRFIEVQISSCVPMEKTSFIIKFVLKVILISDIKNGSKLDDLFLLKNFLLSIKMNIRDLRHFQTFQSKH